MKIGDKVNFLNETGGGRIAGFQGKNIVMVEDGDGFQIPVSIHDVVVVSESKAYDMGKVVAKKMQSTAQSYLENNDIRSVKAKIQNDEDDANLTTTEEIPLEKEISFRKSPEERKGGNQLSAFIAFVPIDIKEITNTRFEIYFINDCNYYMHYVCMVADGNNWSLRYSGEVEPNTKLFIDEIDREDLNEINRLCFQVISFKREKAFIYKPVIDIQLRLNTVKFYKLHTFQNNKFFETPALIYTIIENDIPCRSLIVDPIKLKTEMYQKDLNLNENNPNELTYLGGKQENAFRRKHQEDKDVIIVDLHINSLLDNINGMSPTDILNYQLKKFRTTLDENANKMGQKIIFIHGKGEGVLRRTLINDLNYRYKKYQYQDASFQEYGYGATQVTIK